MKSLRIAILILSTSSSCSKEKIPLETSNSKSIVVLAGAGVVAPEPLTTLGGALILVGYFGGKYFYETSKTLSFSTEYRVRKATPQEISQAREASRQCTNQQFNDIHNRRKHFCSGKGKIGCTKADSGKTIGEKVINLNRCKNARIDEMNCYLPEARDGGAPQSN